MFGIEWPNWDWSMYFDKTTALGQVIELLIYTAIAAIITTIVLALYNRFVKKALKKKNNIQIRFTQNIIRALIIVVAIIWVLMSSTATTDIGKVLFQGTAIIGAVIGLAAQPVDWRFVNKLIRKAKYSSDLLDLLPRWEKGFPSGPWPPWRGRGESPSEIGSVSLSLSVSAFSDSALAPFLLYLEIRNSDWIETFAQIFFQKLAFLRPK